MKVVGWAVADEPTRNLKDYKPISYEALREKCLRKDAYPMEVFTRLKPSALLVRPSPLRRFHDLKRIEKERCTQTVNIEHIYTAVFQMHKTIAEGSQRRCTEAQVVHNAMTHVLPFRFDVGDYVMIGTPANRGYKLQSRLWGPMMVAKAKSHLVFEMNNINDGSELVVHAQRMVPYPFMRRSRQASIELREQSKSTTRSTI